MKLYRFFFVRLLKKQTRYIKTYYALVDILNKELEDPHITTDPTKLSSLHQQSEKLLQMYHSMESSDRQLPVVLTLSEAHERVKEKLEDKWRRSFSKTSEYFELVYGSREIKEVSDRK